jgi:4-hydroxythreonine-4-phosphate dehydrogenase
MMEIRLPPLAVTMGEPAGIGGEIALKTWLNGRDGAKFFLIDDPERLTELARSLDLDVPIQPIEGPEDAAAQFEDVLPVLPLTLGAPSRPGQPNPAHALAVVESIERAVALVQDGRAAAIVTNPIRKQTLYEAGFTHPGHTEFLGSLVSGEQTPIMMLACPGLRVVPVTVHLPLREAINRLTGDAIVEAGTITAAALRRDFGLEQPRLAVAALNPHGGEGGHIGREEIEIIAPAVERLRAEGVEVTGPAPADTLFHAAARTRYDAVLCMYHDQAMIPLKTIDFERGVNITLGLPFIRTGPDHGTALDIAGTGRASEASLIAALSTAAAMARRRACAQRRSAVA